MKMKKTKNRPAFTLVELIAATVIAIIAIAPIAVSMVNSQRTWQTAYDRIYADVVTRSYAARKRFDSLIRKAGSSTVTVDKDKEGIMVRYYSSNSASYMDRYAYLYLSNDGILKVEYGMVASTSKKGNTSTVQNTSTEIICENVSSCTFLKTGNSAQMFLTLDDGSKSYTVISSALMHN